MATNLTSLEFPGVVDVIVDLTAEEIASPDALIIGDIDATFRLKVPPYTRYFSDGTELINVTTPTDVSGAFVTATGSSTPRTMARRAADVFNIKDYGAIGNGTTDNRAAIVAAMGSGNRTVYFPTGTYRIAGPTTITWPSNTSFLGDGPAQSIIKPDGAFTHAVFQNTLLTTLTAFTTIPTTSSVQTDVGFIVRDIGIDCTTFTGSVFAFLFARNILFQNVWMNNYHPSTDPTYTAIQFLGCDNCVVDNVITRNVTSAVNGWKGTTNVKVSNLYAVAGLAADTGVVALNGQGTIISDQEFSSGFEITNSTIELASNAVALFFDSLAGGSSVTDVMVSNVIVKATGGTANYGLVARGRGGRVKINGLTLTAESGAGFVQPVIVGGFYDTFATYTAFGIVTAVNGSSIVTVSMPLGTTLGPGNYLNITADGGGNLVGRGLTLNGNYLVTGVTGPSSQFQSGTSVTVQVPMNATSSGTIALSTAVQGYLGSFSDCEFNGVTLDGVVATGSDLFAMNGISHVFSNIVHTENYNGSSSPQYRSVIATNALNFTTETTRPISVSNIMAEPGTGSLPPGFVGNNLITWNPGYPPPIIMATVRDPSSTAALPSGGGTMTGGIDFGLSDAPGPVNLSRHIKLYSGYGFNVYSSGLHYVSGGAHNFYVGSTQIAFIDANGYSGPIGQEPGAESLGTFTVLRVGNSVGPTINGGAGIPSYTAPIGSLWSRTDGGVGSTLYVSRGGGSWNAVAGV